MAKEHKAATEITIAPTEQETALRTFVMAYWPHALVISVTATGWILFSGYQTESAVESEMEAWGSLGVNVKFESLGGGFGAVPSAGVMNDVADQLADTTAGPWAKAIEVGKRLRDDDLDGARAAMNELSTTWPEHAILQAPFFARGGEERPARTLANHVNDTAAALTAWEADHPSLFSNPGLREGAPRVRITTSAGQIVVGLYDERAPEHAANFLKLCRESFYDGTKFHRVVADLMIQGGDPNSKTEETDENPWGQGGPGYTLEPEPASLWHFPGAVASAATAAGGPTSGSQFYIVTGDDQHHLDGDYTVWDELLEGQDIVSAIENAPKLGEKPEEPVVIESTTVL